MNNAEHWEEIYRTSDTARVSWFQSHSTRSLELITEYLPDRAKAIIDVGAGASILVDNLLDAGYRDITLMDISPAALDKVATRITGPGSAPNLVVGDILTSSLPTARYDLWHDRAVFHFLVTKEDRQRYLAQLERALRPGGLAVIATFAADGPTRCSGLDVVRYSERELAAELGATFEPLEAVKELHPTPSGGEQRFIYEVFRRLGEEDHAD